MTATLRPRSTRVSLILLAGLAQGLAGCVSAPVQTPEGVKLKADSLSPKYSSFNARVLSDAASVHHTFVASLDPQMRPLTRLESSYTRTIGEGERLRVGDAVSSVGMWGTAVRYGGMQFGTRSTTRADVIDATRLATSGVAVLPTVADALFASAADPGTTLARQDVSVNRSFGSGSKAWDLVARDTFGRSVSISGPMIASTTLLAEPGCTDFSIGFGKVRRDYALSSNDYGPAFANTTVTCGAPLGFTVEGHGEYLADEVAAVGIGIARRVGPLGTASVAFASSRAEEGSGWLARVGFEHRNSLFNLMLRSRVQSREFREVGTTLLEDPVMERDLASIGIDVGEGASLSLAYAAQTTWARERTNLVALKQSVSLGQGSLSMSAGHSLADNFGSSWFISYRRPFGFSRPERSVVQELDLEALGEAMLQ